MSTAGNVPTLFENLYERKRLADEFWKRFRWLHYDVSTSLAAGSHVLTVRDKKLREMHFYLLTGHFYENGILEFERVQLERSGYLFEPGLERFKSRVDSGELKLLGEYLPAGLEFGGWEALVVETGQVVRMPLWCVEIDAKHTERARDVENRKMMLRDKEEWRRKALEQEKRRAENKSGRTSSYGEWAAKRARKRKLGRQLDAIEFDPERFPNDKGRKKN